jgi:hypothetical protein
LRTNKYLLVPFILCFYSAQVSRSEGKVNQI